MKINQTGGDVLTGNLVVSSPSYQKALHIANQFSSIPFPNGWKANLNGVDLNLQFPARMGKCKRN